MIKCINLRFFGGGGGTSVQEVEKREPKSDQLKAMDDAVYGLMGGLMQRYGGVSMPSIRSYTGSGSSGSSGSAGSYGRPGTGEGWATGRDGIGTYDGQRVRYDEYGRPYTASYYTGGERQGEERSRKYITGSVPSGASDYTATAGGKLGGSGGGTYAAGYDDSGWGANGYLTKAFDTADELTNAANANSAQLLHDVPDYLKQSAGYLADHADLLANGTNAGLQNVVNEMNKSVYSGMQKTAGSALSNWAKKGIVNSSVATSGINDIENAAANAAAGNYSNAWGTMLQNYLGGAQSARENYDSGIAGLKTFADLPQQYYGNALAPLTPAYNYWKDATSAWLANDKDYIATSSGK